MLIDTEKFQTLKTRMNTKFPQLTERYLIDSTNYLNKIHCNLKSGNLEDVAAAAHNLKSSSGLLGFTSLFDISQKIEYAAKSNDPQEQNATDLTALCDSLIEHVKLAQVFINHEMGKDHNALSD